MNSRTVESWELRERPPRSLCRDRADRISPEDPFTGWSLSFDGTSSVGEPERLLIVESHHRTVAVQAGP